MSERMVGPLPVCGDLDAERPQRVGIDLGEGGEWLDRVAQHVERYTRADGQRGLLEPLARLWSERVRAREPVAFTEEGQKAVRLGIGACVGSGPRDARNRRAGSEARLERANRRGLRIGEDNTREGFIVGYAWLAQDVRGDDVALVLPGRRQWPDAGHVADRPDPIGGAQVHVDRDSVAVGRDADGLEPDAVDTRTATGRDEQPVTPQFAAVVEGHDVVVAVTPR